MTMNEYANEMIYIYIGNSEMINKISDAMVFEHNM